MNHFYESITSAMRCILLAASILFLTSTGSFLHSKPLDWLDTGSGEVSALQTARQEARTLSPEVLWNIKRIGAPVVSPDGRWVVAPVTRYTIEDDQGHTDLWLFASDGSLQRPLTRHGSAEGQPVFSPDGARLAFVSRREEDQAPQLYILPVDEPGEARRYFDIPTGVSAPKWIGNHIYFISRVWPKKTWEEMEQEIERQSNSMVSARIWNRLPFSHWDHWLEEDRQAHLFRIPFIEQRGDDSLDLTHKIEPVTLPAGRELSRSAPGPGSYDVAFNESLVAFVSDTHSDDTDPKLDIYLIEPGSSEARNITADNQAPDTQPLFSPDGNLLAFTRQHIKGFYADNRILMIHNVETGRLLEITGAWDRSADGLIWSPDARGLYGAIDDAGTRRLYFIDIESGEPSALTDATDYMNLSISANGVMAALNHSFLYPPRLVVFDRNKRTLQRIDSLNDRLLEEISLGTYEEVTYQGYDGQDIQMWVHYPPDFDPEKKYPLFLLIHGGPHSAITDGFHFRWNAQTFASWGYVTAWHNFHGSSGFGRDFTDSINPDWLTRPYADTRKAAEWFAGQSWIDADRMVAGGGSYGGYLSSILLGKEHPFNALVIHAPVYNMYSQMAADFAVHLLRFGDYWEHDIYRRISPHYYAGQFHTPALIIHGQLDYRVPVGQAFELFRTLQHRGIESRLIYFPDENHWILKPNNSIEWYREVREWIARFAEPGPG